jgi:pimeloyl-ACP methyl ester carboxylesterase
LITEAFGQQLAGMGYAVVAPDYAGMGVDTGMTSFLVGRAEAAATLDGLRALLSFREPRFDARTLGKELFLVGYSQGAHASLFAHQALDEHLGLHLLGSISYAPPMGDARAWLGDLAHADRPTDSASIFVAMSLYSHMLHSGAPEPSTWLSPDAAAKLPPLFHDECLATLPRPVASAFPFKRDFYRPAFLDAATRCTRSSDCSDFEPWHSEFAAEEPGDFQSTAPALILQGMADQVVPPETVACIRDRLRRRGTPVVACGYPGADHWTVVGASISDVVRWMNARRAGQQIDVCQTPLEVPCSAFH